MGNSISNVLNAKTLKKCEDVDDISKNLIANLDKLTVSEYALLAIERHMNWIIDYILLNDTDKHLGEPPTGDD